MNKKKAWTLIELTLAFIILASLVGGLASVFKPKTKNIQFNAYTATRNLQDLSHALIDREGSYITNPTNDMPIADVGLINSTVDELCNGLGDVSSAINVNCARTSAGNYTTENIVFANGYTILGIAGPWVQQASGSNKMLYKDVIVDVDSPSAGLNTQGTDRFPYRIYYGMNADGTIRPLNCSAISSGACEGSTINYEERNNLISYDVFHYNQKKHDEGIKQFATLVKTAATFKQAYCDTNGRQNNNEYDIYTTECTVNSECSGDYVCFVELHKPAAGAGILFNQVADMLME